MNIRQEGDMKEDVVVKIKEGMLRWFSHVEHMDNERLTKKIYMEEMSGEKKV